jgi:hypothetical protein
VHSVLPIVGLYRNSSGRVRNVEKWQLLQLIIVEFEITARKRLFSPARATASRSACTLHKFARSIDKADQDSALINAARNTGRSLISNVLANREQFHQSRLVKESMPQIFMEYSCDVVLRSQSAH